MVAWVEVLHDDTLTCLALVQGYGLTVIGGDDVWVWFIELHGHNILTGAAEELLTAKFTAETAAYLLAYEQQSDPESGSA